MLVAGPCYIRYLSDSVSITFRAAFGFRWLSKTVFLRSLSPVPITVIFLCKVGWSGGAMVLGKRPVPGRLTYLEYSRAGAYCVCGGCGWGLFGHFSLVYYFSFLSPSLCETARYRLKYCLRGPLTVPQNNQPTKILCKVHLDSAQNGNYEICFVIYT